MSTRCRSYITKLSGLNLHEKLSQAFISWMCARSLQSNCLQLLKQVRSLLRGYITSHQPVQPLLPINVILVGVGSSAVRNGLPEEREAFIQTLARFRLNLRDDGAVQCHVSVLGLHQGVFRIETVRLVQEVLGVLELPMFKLKTPPLQQ